MNNSLYYISATVFLPGGGLNRKEGRFFCEYGQGEGYPLTLGKNDFLISQDAILTTRGDRVRGPRLPGLQSKQVKGEEVSLSPGEEIFNFLTTLDKYNF